MKQSCTYAVFDSDDWVFICPLTGSRCPAGKHFPDLNKCPHKFDDIFVHKHIRESFDRLFPTYAQRLVSWAYESPTSIPSIYVVLDNQVVLIFEYQDDFNFKLYTRKG